MKRLATTFLLFFVCCQMGRAQQVQSSKGVFIEGTNKKIAVLIGINDYAQLRPLRYTKNDITAIRDQLYKIGFEKENVFTLVCGGSEKERPTKERIMTTIQHATELAREGDILFVAMSGHGVETNDGQARFCSIETNPEDLSGTTVPISDIFGAVGDCKATFKLMLVDACRNDPFRGRASFGAKTIAALDAPPRGALLFQSCAKDEISLEDDEFKRGIFSHFIIEGLSGKAADKEGQVTLLGLSDYVIEQTRRRAYNLETRRQVPYMKGEFTNFVLAKISIAPPLPVVPPTPPPAPSPTRAGERMTLTIKGVDYAFRWCPPGTFTMGSPQGEHGRFGSETLHQVTLSRGFWMLETVVTQEMWESVMGSNPSGFEGIKLPVETVSWNDCQEYITTLKALLAGTPGAPAGFTFSLPTEAQWEYACRAGTTTAYHFGNTLTKPQANFGGNQTKEVGSYPANAWGLYDMHGNVREWCADWYEDYPSGAVTDPVGFPSGLGRVLRGGGWNNAVESCRSAYRCHYVPSVRYYDRGFRLALVSQ
jgi:hypothetical protein